MFFENIPDPSISKFVIWVGGKRNHLHHITKYFPKEYEHYYEPFVGGGSVFIHNYKKKLSNKNIFWNISDYNSELINCYIDVRDNLEEILKFYTSYNNEEKEYYERRSQYNSLIEPSIEKSALFMYLMYSTIKGKYRTNSKGHFNSSFGFKDNAYMISKERIMFLSIILQRVSVKNCSYEDIIPSENSFVFMDPPYHNTMNNYNHNNADSDIFHLQLKKYCDNISKVKNVKFCMTNSATDFNKELYKDYNVFYYETHNKMSNAAGCYNKEMLIRNF
jgi:DNA adenine methylase